MIPAAGEFRDAVLIFDMDGTITRPLLDFDAMRADIGLPPGPILESLERLAPAERDRAETILRRHETEAAHASELQPGAQRVLADLRTARFPLALMTRNTRDSVRIILDKHKLQFDLIRTREDGAIKPSPQPVFDLCQRLDRWPTDAWVIGDFHFDILCGLRAGATTVAFLDPDQPRPDWADEAHHVIHMWSALPPLLPAIKR